MSTTPEADTTNAAKPNSLTTPKRDQEGSQKDQTGPKPAEEKPKETTEEQDAKKLQTLRTIIKEQMEIYIKEIPNIVDLRIQQLIKQQQQPGAPQQSPQQTPQQQTMQEFHNLPPEVKGDLIAKLGVAAAQVLQAWKGGPNNPQNNESFCR